ncbi:hypothetical protein JCM19233_3307 [Vibrio astriarenae]|nr:hypothetical protein JCM19233_3307 [Vibrio sp. C7]
MKGKEGYDAILEQEAGSIVTTVSMAECFAEYLQEGYSADLSVCCQP